MGKDEIDRQIELQRKIREQRQKRMKRLRRKRRILIAVLAGIFLVILLGIVWLVEVIRKPKQVDLDTVEMPSWIEQNFIRVNEFSRPGKKLERVNGIVIHYVGNPGTTAMQNRNYFDSLADQTGDNKVSVSSNFIIGLEGEIVQCMPLDEVAYASNQRNSDTISIECCHPDATGEFTPETYESMVKLTAWLCEKLDLDAGDVIRHYDVTKKKCPLYFVDHKDAWKQFRADVKKKMREK